MRGSDERSGSLFSYVDLEARVRRDHPLRTILEIANAALADLTREFAALYPARLGRPSIAPERLLRAMLLQAFYGIRSERQLMERMEFDLLFRWFVGLGVDEPAWIIRASRRIGIGCWKARSRPSSWRQWWRSLG
jgi:transposase